MIGGTSLKGKMKCLESRHLLICFRDIYGHSEKCVRMVQAADLAAKYNSPKNTWQFYKVYEPLVLFIG